MKHEPLRSFEDFYLLSEKNGPSELRETVRYEYVFQLTSCCQKTDGPTNYIAGPEFEKLFKIVIYGIVCYEFAA